MEDKREKLKKLIATVAYFCLMLALFLGLNLLELRGYNRLYNQRLNDIILTVTEKYPEVSKNEIYEILNGRTPSGQDLLGQYGIDIEKDAAILEIQKEFWRNMLLNSFLILMLALLPLAFVLFTNCRRDRKIRQITDELANINKGDYQFDMNSSDEGQVSILENELFKTAITLKEAAENSQKDKDNLKDALSNISHQLKTPLTSLLINLENLEEFPDISAEKRNEIIGHARRDVNRVNQMVQMILKLSKMDAEAIQFERRETPLKALVNAAVENVAALSDLKGIEVTVDAESDREACLTCDPYWETEALSNILKNGIEHAESRVTVSYKNFSLYKEITVTNDGAVISQEDAKNIFKRFYSGETANPDSTGIGLALADSIVRRDGGYIIAEGLEEEQFQGTRFVLRYMQGN